MSINWESVPKDNYSQISNPVEKALSMAIDFFARPGEEEGLPLDESFAKRTLQALEEALDIFEQPYPTGKTKRAKELEL